MEHRIEILIQDPWFLVVNKPIGLLTQAPAGIPNLQESLVVQLASPGGAKPFIGIPHRLDRMTSGVVVVARNQRALRRLCDQFAARTIEKVYLAWVASPGTAPSVPGSGRELPETGVWEDWMRKVPDEPRAEITPPGAEGARIASLSYRVLATRQDRDGASEKLLRIRLNTGRMHQIRLQCGSRGLPIIGDRLYGSTQAWGNVDENYREPPIALHAYKLGFRHPKTAEPIVATAPTPTEFPWGDWLETSSEIQ